MGRIHAHITAAVGSGLLHGDLACGRSHRYKLLSNDHRSLYGPAVHGHFPCFCMDLGAFDDFTFRADRNRFDQRHGFGALQVLDHAPADQAHRDHQIQRN